MIRAVLKTSVPRSTYRMWLAPLRPTVIRAGTLHLDGPDATCTWVERRFADVLEHAISTSRSTVDRFSFEPAQPEAVTTSAIPAPAANPTHTFDRFVIGPGNHLAHSSALAVAEAPSEAYNPLFLHGSPGLGKTHLLGAIANYLEQQVPELNVLYTNAETFTAEFVTSLRQDGAQEFKRRHRHLDVLLIDDIQFIAGKTRTEEEFFHTFNTLHEAGAQIVISADRAPAEISALADRLSDRFEWGLTVRLDSPNLATRLTVLRHLVSESGLDVPDQEALTLLARRVESNLRQLRGALTRTLAEASLKAVPVTSDLVTSILPGREVEPLLPVTPEAVAEASAAQYGLSTADLEGRRRDRRTRDARNVAIFLTREMTDLSLPRIGQIYGGRDHSTVLNSVRRVEGSLDQDPDLTAAVESIRARIHSPAPPT
ncbi:MAG: chromosomal replication initiator protein DnaA [Solirubrobacterales bacterium]|nr:chromosomal replication initiator protein DnaA [Solirubrobacterales bacterium]